MGAYYEDVPEDHLLMILDALAPVARSVKLRNGLRLKTAAAAATFARSAPRVTDLEVSVHRAPPPAVAATLLGLMGNRLQSLALCSVRDWDVDALAMLGVCRGLRHLRVHGIGGRKELPLSWLAPLKRLRTLDLSGTKSTGSATADDVAAFAGMTALTCLAMPERAQQLAHGETHQQQQQQLYEAIGALRHLVRLDLGDAPLTVATLAALASSPVTLLGAADLHTATAALAPLPPGLVRLVLAHPPSVAALAGLAPVPASLESISPCMDPDCKNYLHICLLPSAAPAAPDDDGPVICVEQQLLDSVPDLMPAAVALLASRLQSIYDGALWLGVKAWADHPYCDPPSATLAGGRLGHAAWLQHLGPLQWRHLRLADLALAAGDLGALAAALPRMEGLELQHCTFLPSALLELAPMPGLADITIWGCDESIGCPEGMAMLTELCHRLEAVKRVNVKVKDLEELRPGAFSWAGAASQAQEALQARGKLVQVLVNEQ